ncbi:MAG: lysophospholipase [Pirellulaceae bacterium]|nr:lysophospholipase [Pirellulaceae bacterium]
MINPLQTRYGSLDCIVVDGGETPDVAVVLCHGYGAPGSDLAGLSAAWIQMLGDQADRFRFVFPAAPHTLADLGMPDGRAWWPLNMARMMEAIEANAFDELHQHEPTGIVSSREALCETIDLVKQELGGASTTLALGGFSQGAMLTMDTALRGTIEPPQLLIQFSGTLICEAQWRAAIGRLADTKVYQSHGEVDPILPFASAQRLHQLLVDGGVDAEFHAFRGPHTIDQDSIEKTTLALQELICNAQ